MGTPGSGSGLIATLEWLYRVILLAYPRAFRRAHGREMIEAFRDSCLAAAQGGRLRLLRHGLHAMGELLFQGLMERLAAAGRLVAAANRLRPELLGSLPGDVRFALRGFRRDRGLFLTVVAVLALGIGANTAVYSVVQSVLLEPLPYPEPDRVVRVRQTLASWRDHPNPILAGMADDFPVEWGVLQDWVRFGHSFQAIGAHRGARYVIAGDSGPDWIDAEQTSSGVFAALNVAPALGRLFSPDDDIMGAEQVAILSHGFWQRAFGADPETVGRTLLLSGTPYRIVGVMPAGFYFPTRARALWTRLDDEYLRIYEGGQSLLGLGRLKLGVSLEEAQADLARASDRIRSERPGRSEGFGVRLWRQHEYLVGPVRPIMTLLFASVLAVLLIACANASGLLVIRSNRRRRELELRRCLGADWRRIGSQLVTESLLLATAAGAAALVVTLLTHRLLIGLIPDDLPRFEQIPPLDGHVLFFAAVVTVACGVCVAALPVVRTSRASHSQALGRGGRTTTADRGRLHAQSALVVTEIALTVPLVAATGLLGGSLVRLTTVDLGLDPTGVYEVDAGLYGERYDSPQEKAVFRRLLRERLAGLPGVLQVTACEQSPYSGFGSGGQLRIVTADDEIQTNVKWARVGRDFFSAMGIQLLAGRSFEPSDRDVDGGVAIINAAMARRFWPDSDPLGQTIYRGDDVNGRRIIGVVGDVKPGTPSEATTALVHLPSEDVWLTVVKTAGGHSELQAGVERILRDIDPTVPSQVVSLEERVRMSTAQPRFRALVIGLFATLAAVLALVGIGGILSYAVAQRRREIGVRMAVGATGGQIMRGVLVNGLALVASGLVVGGAISFLGVRLIRAFLFETSVGDPATLVATVGLLVSAGLAVSLLPARRASKVDPNAVLNVE